MTTHHVLAMAAYRRSRFTGLLFASLVIATTMLCSASTHAQSGSAAQGVELSPAIIELNAKPGGMYKLTIGVTNVTAGDLSYKVSIEDFTTKDETGSPKILRNSNLSPRISVRTWVSSFVPTFHLGSHKSIAATFAVNVPKNAEPGGHYGVIDFSGADTEVKSTGVGLTASAGTLLLVKVAGDVKEQASIASFYTADSSKESNFFENAPVNFVTRIQNTGNIHVKPFGSIELKNMFGSTVATLPVNGAESNVLPDSIRRFDNRYADYMIGLYTATLTVGYGTKGEAIMASTTFWVIPYKLIATILLVLAFVVFVFRRLQKAYNRRVIKKYQNTQQKNKDESKKTKH